ncbi:putative protein TOPLESS [Capsicum annuum]|nr:putative protein TOPLESS [Capsicum annuum]
MEYLECKFSDSSPEADVVVKLDSEAIQKRDNFRIDKVRNEISQEKVGVDSLEDKIGEMSLRVDEVDMRRSLLGTLPDLRVTHNLSLPMARMKSSTYDIVNCGVYSYNQVSHVCQFPFIESLGLLVPENIVVCLEPCHVVMISSIKPCLVEFSQSCDSGNLNNLMNSVSYQTSVAILSVNGNSVKSVPVQFYSALSNFSSLRQGLDPSSAALAYMGHVQLHDFQTSSSSSISAIRVPACTGTDISHGLASGPSGSWAPCSIPYTLQYAIPWAIWNPPSTQRPSPQSKFATRIGVSIRETRKTTQHGAMIPKQINMSWDCWQNEEVKIKVEIKKVAYTKLVKRKDDDERQMDMEEYKMKGGDKKLYRLAKAREKRARDLDQRKVSTGGDVVDSPYGGYGDVLALALDCGLLTYSSTILKLIGGNDHLEEEHQEFDSMPFDLCPYAVKQHFCSNVTQPEEEDAHGTLQKWKIKVGKAMFALKTTTEEDILEHIRDAKTPKEAWDTFAKLF